jgi:phage portal protein BeeE
VNEPPRGAEGVRVEVATPPRLVGVTPVKYARLEIEIGEVVEIWKPAF